MRQERGSNGSTRSSALWGKPSKGESRSSALWGKGGRGLMSAVLAAMVMVTPVAATAGSSGSSTNGIKAYLSNGLLRAAQSKPNATFDVIVQATRGKSTASAAADVADAKAKNPGKGVGLRKKYLSISGVAAQLTGKQIVALAKKPYVASITSDVPVVLSGGLTNKQRWPVVTGIRNVWSAASAPNAPAIAVVDSGIEAGRSDFGGRVVAQVNLTSILPNSAGDGRGHGTFVAGIAAGSGTDYAGASPYSKIVSIDVMDDNGMAMTRDVIAAADWILQNKTKYNIRVANFSLHNSAWASVMFDPLDRAVEKLWFSGVVVVAASGNYGVDGQPSGVPYSPGNDPFVITVGADDVDGSVATNDDLAAPWSAYGYTLDGFAKPDLAAPGRYMVGPVPVASTLPLERPANVSAPGYMQLSGTSFAAPVVAGAAAQLLAAHPTWTPDQVKGALMLAAKPAGDAAPLSVGVGVLDLPRAMAVTSPPNPNLALNQFLVSESGGSGKVFNAASWAAKAAADASWASASWASASWTSASWASASWASASWASASWASASWASDSAAAASWADASWASASWADNAEGDANPAGEFLTPEELAALSLGSTLP
jgi:serine protease AprX